MSRRLRSRAAAIEAKRAFAWASPVVHDHDDEPADSSSPAGTYGCACVLSDPAACLVVRGGYGACTCLCHQWRDHDD